MPNVPADPIAIPNAVDRRILEEEYDRVPKFLQSAQRVRELELANGNGGFFHILAEQWKLLASLQYLCRESPVAILASVERWLEHVVIGMELGQGIETRVMLEYFLGAAATGNDACSYCLATAPGDLLGFSDDPDSLWPLFGRVGFAFLREEDDEARTFLELLHGHLFEAPPNSPAPLGKVEMVNLQRLAAAVLSRDGAAFNEQLQERCRLRAVMIESESDGEIPQVIDWVALGFCAFARQRGMTTNFRHPYLPFILTEPPAD